MLSFLVGSLGDEASISYTVEYPHEILRDPVIELGAGAPDGSWLATNLSEAESGRIGILIGTPNAYMAGTRQMVTMKFEIPQGAAAGTYPIEFTDSVVPKGVSSVEGGAMLPNIDYETGYVVLVRNATGVEVSGRVTTPDGRGLRNATVELIDSKGNRRTTTTGSFGNYRFADVEPGETYVIAVTSKRYRFTSRTVNVSDTLTDVDFVGLE
jgi:hypothetical protein